MIGLILSQIINLETIYLKNPNNFIKSKINYLNKKFIKYQKKEIICTLMLSGSSEIKKLNKNLEKK